MVYVEVCLFLFQDRWLLSLVYDGITGKHHQQRKCFPDVFVIFIVIKCSTGDRSGESKYHWLTTVDVGKCFVRSPRWIILGRWIYRLVAKWIWCTVRSTKLKKMSLIIWSYHQFNYCAHQFNSIDKNNNWFDAHINTGYRN